MIMTQKILIQHQAQFNSKLEFGIKKNLLGKVGEHASSVIMEVHNMDMISPVLCISGLR